MVSIGYRWLFPLALLAAGCSSTGILGGRLGKGHKPMENAFAGAEEDTSDGRVELVSDPNRKKAGALTDEQRAEIDRQLAEAARHQRSDNSAAARAAFERVLRIDPDHPFATYELAVIADNEGRFEEAVRRYQALLRRAPRDPQITADVLASLGWSYHLQQRYQESEQALRQALAINPRHATALDNLGRLYAAQGDYDRALGVFRAAGSEDQAQRALAEFFPHGRPDPAAAGPTETLPNPFEGNAGQVAAGVRFSPRGSAVGRVSAPAPWNDRADATRGAPLVSRGSTGGKSAPGAPRAAESFDRAFAELEAVARPAAVVPPAVPAGGPATVTPAAGATAMTESPPSVRTAEHEDLLPLPPDASGPPRINPRGETAAGQATTTDRALGGEVRVAARDELPGRTWPGDTPSNSDAPPASLAADGAASRRQSLPDWPHSPRHPPSGGTTGGGAPAANPGAAAARLGLSAGPHGLLFPFPSP